MGIDFRAHTCTNTQTQIQESERTSVMTMAFAVNATGMFDVEASCNWCIGLSFHKNTVGSTAFVRSFGVWDDHTVETSAYVDPGESVQCLNFAKEVDL